MVKPTELRINNWIADHEGAPRQVAYIGETIGVHNDAGGTQKYQHNPIFSGDINSLQPIPLTPELLEVCGFNKSGGSFSNSWYQDSDCNELYFDGTEASWEFDGKSIVKGIKHLHQLQNLYFTLTGEELEVKLPQPLK